MSDCDLAGAAIVITRPVHQAAHLAASIRELGGEPVVFPGVAIVPVAQPRLSQALSVLPGVHWVIFASPNAARIGMQAIASAGGMPPAARVAAIGPGTATELENSGVRNVITPRAGHDSESLAACPELVEVGGKRVLIVRGVGGRELLARTLAQRGAEVSYLECYRRSRPLSGDAEIDALWHGRAIAGWTATSAEIVDNLFEIAGERGRRWLCRTPLFVTHSRIAANAFRLAVETIVVTAPGDAGLVAGLATWICRLRPAKIGSSETP